MSSAPPLRQPAGLRALFLTELWERFSYYGLRGLLILYMTAAVGEGGLGFDTATAGAIYGIYSGLVYLACLPGGWIADRFIGAQRATWYGGILILSGHLCLAAPISNTFVLGLSLVILGTGLLKPNISTMVGQLYTADDPRRDGGFSIYYMGINLGAFLAPLVCGWLALGMPFRGMLRHAGLAPELAWHWGFGAAAIGMALGLFFYWHGRSNFSRQSLRPAHAPSVQEQRRLVQGLLAGTLLIGGALVATHTGGLSIARISDLFGLALMIITVGFFGWIFTTPGWSHEERHNLRLILVLFIGAVVFWSLFEQGGSTLNLFAARDTNRHLPWFDFEFPATWFQSINPILIIALAPLFAAWWTRLGARNPPSTHKFIAGLIFASAGFAVLIVAAKLAADGHLVSPWWLIVTYSLHTLGELCLSPVGLSAMSRLAPARIAGLTMGVWFLATSIGNYLGGRAASFYDTLSLPELFTAITVAGALAAILLALAMRLILKPRTVTS